MALQTNSEYIIKYTQSSSLSSAKLSIVVESINPVFFQKLAIIVPSISCQLIQIILIASSMFKLYRLLVSSSSINDKAHS